MTIRAWHSTSIQPNERGISACKGLLRAARYYGGPGVRIERVLTDNGASYRSRSIRRRVRHGMRYLRAPPTPRTPKARLERLVQSSLREWAYARS